jgi:LCP family protein required for cell wall assembly
MAGILSTTSLSRRRAVQFGAGAMVAAMTGIGSVAARQNANEYTFIVAGVDYREGFDEHNSDVLMVSRVNLDAGTVRTVAIPRDLYVEIPGFGYNKINAAFNLGFYNSEDNWAGGTQAMTDTIQANFGLAIDGAAVTTFEGFKQIVDALGGVEVNNPYEVIGISGIDSFPAGVQTLNGDAALAFVRTRKQDGDDGRVMRQQLVLAAILQELQSPSVVTKIPDLVETLRDTVYTNIPADVQLQLVAALPNISMDNVSFTLITDYLSGGIIDNGMWVYQADWSVLPGVVQGYLAGQ